MLPYTMVIQKTEDILSLERDIRKMLRCQGNSCAFLQSAEYKTVKYAMTRAIHEGPGGLGHLLHIPHSNLVRCRCFSMLRAGSVLPLF